MRKIRKTVILFLLIYSANYTNGQTLSAIPSGSLLACGDDKVLIIDPEKGADSTAVIWSWSVKEAEVDLPERYQKLLVPLDECKPIDNNTKILLTSSGGATCIVDVASRKVEFYANTPMAHSADLLPDGFVAVANSTHPKGNSIEIYHRSKSEELLFKDTLYSGHGAVWHHEKNRLFVLGFDEVRCYEFKKENGGAVRLQLKYKDTLPENGGHDLSQVDADRFLITAHDNVFLYNVDTRIFTPFDKLNVPHVKSVNYFSDTDYLVYTKAEEKWWTFNIYLINPHQIINLPFLKIYKVRVVR